MDELLSGNEVVSERQEEVIGSLAHSTQNTTRDIAVNSKFDLYKFLQRVLAWRTNLQWRASRPTSVVEVVAALLDEADAVRKARPSCSTTWRICLIGKACSIVRGDRIWTVWGQGRV